MSFKHSFHRPLMFCPEPVEVPIQVSNFDGDGVEHVSYTTVSAQSVIDSLPSPSEFDMSFSAKAGLLNPVSLSDFEVSNINSDNASDIINSLNVPENENS